MSIQTKEVPTALDNLLRAKGQRKGGEAVVQHPTAVVVENQHTEVTATPAPALEPVVPVTPGVQELEPTIEDPYQKRYTDLKTYHDTSIYEARQEIATLKHQLSQAPSVTKTLQLPKTKEQLAAFREQNPEAADTIISLVREEIMNGELLSDITNSIGEVKKAQSELREEKAFKSLLEEHPDALDIKKSPQFAKWFNEQPADIQRILATSSDYKAVSKQLTLYKLEVLGLNPKEKQKAENQAREDASLAVPVTGRVEITAQKKIWTKTEIDRICANYNLWNKHRAEIDEARREGRVDPTK